jgi:YVTN family beta-propeller protein
VHGIELTEVPASAHGLKFCDTLEIDHATHRLYAGDNWAAGVDVFDISSPRASYVKTIRARGLFYGICVATELQKVFVGMAGGTVSVIDVDPASSTFDTVVARVDVGGRGHADLIEFDPLHRKVYVANRNDGFLTVIDAVTNAAVARIDGLGGGLEQPRFNPADGMVYLSGNADNVLYQVDAAADELVRTLDIGEPCHPNGLAINPSTQKAVLANSGRNSHCVVWDLAAGKLDAVVEETGGGDGVVYDAVADRFFFAASGFPEGPVVGIFDGEGRFLTNVPSARLASWVAYDRQHELLYVPTVNEGRPAVLAIPNPAV